ncbi:MAG: ribbon-helix-helix protein, CopG family [Acidobacteriaceae bacterium]|nr:ribbon-helix-helix protein, CopG family [Acidobacteriaceae bacterium]
MAKKSPKAPPKLSTVFSARLPDEMIARLDRLADKEHRTGNNMLTRILERALPIEEKRPHE